MADTYKVLPQDCWKLIFSRLDILEDVSLVCKEFYSISNSLIHSIELYEPTVQALCRLLKRFPDLKEIDLRLFHGDLDLALTKIARSGLNLEALYVSFQSEVSLEIVLQPRSLRELGRDAKIFGTHSELSELKLELLEARGTMIDDEGLAMIAKRCSGLQYLNLNDCSEVTTRGVKEVVEKCTKLKEINLYKCCNVGADILVSMVCSRPSMRRTIPCHFVPNKDQILHHGVLWF
ncbi:hypothetical protein L1049_003943 [Liquidambar formosana]|uniref:F-box domain-containing protein n=1 Tax=Liquidambar formosana TaxID=63359 RepID=A0AAP0WXY9_LIQFO